MAVNESEAEEILQFLAPTAFGNLKGIAMQYFLGMTGSKEGITFIESNIKFLSAIVQLTYDSNEIIEKDAYLALVNLSAEESVAIKLSKLDSHPEFLFHLLKYVLNTESIFADIVCTILSNISRSVICAHRLVNLMITERQEVGFDRIILAFCQPKYNTKKQNLHYLGPFLSNLTQIQQARKYILDKDKCVIQRLLPFTNFEEAQSRRGGIVGTLRNCCFETAYHEWLLSDSVDILPRLLLPLAGPEEFDDDDMEKLPEDLQYLEPDKQRERDPDIRKMLVEAVNQLCSLKKCREYIRDKNTYVILRELHHWEKDPAAACAIESLIQILIGDEPEEGKENLSTVEIPKEIEEKLDRVVTAADEEIKTELLKTQQASDAT